METLTVTEKCLNRLGKTFTETSCSRGGWPGSRGERGGVEGEPRRGFCCFFQPQPAAGLGAAC